MGKTAKFDQLHLQEVLEVRWEWYCMRDHFHGATLPAGHTLHVISKQLMSRA